MYLGRPVLRRGSGSQGSQSSRELVLVQVLLRQRAPAGQH